VKYEIRFRPRVERQLAALSGNLRQRIMRRIGALADDPHPPGAEALGGDLRGRLRIRVGDYRVIYGAMRDPRFVLVYSVGHRGRVYRDAERQD